jgi:hypothetical protein
MTNETWQLYDRNMVIPLRLALCYVIAAPFGADIPR